jgi:predicted nucleic acid-binding protein
MPLNDPVMERFARLRSDLRSQGQLIPDFDILIAATALEYNLTLVTRNLRHFQRIPSLAIYEQN